MPVTAVLAALGTVRDPELDEPITALGFVSGCTLAADGTAEVRLRLPSFFCAPNFACLIVADAYDAVASVPGVRTARVLLEDHFAAETINDRVAARAGFGRAIGSEAADDLRDLRAAFLRKAVLAGTDQVCRALRLAGADEAGMHALTLGDVPPSSARDRLVERRAQLGLPAGDNAPLLVDPDTGVAVSPDAVPEHLQRARVTRVSMTANGSVCRAMLRHWYSGRK